LPVMSFRLSQQLNVDKMSQSEQGDSQSIVAEAQEFAL